MTYSIHNLSEKQLKVIQQATDLFMRIQLGQFNRIFEYLPLKEDIPQSVEEQISALLSKFMINNVDGIRSSLGIGNENLPESTTIALDIHNTIRKELTNYSSLQWSKESLPTIEKNFFL